MALREEPTHDGLRVAGVLLSLYGDITMLHDDFKVAFAEASDNGAAPEKAVELYDAFYDPDEDDEVLALG